MKKFLYLCTAVAFTASTSSQALIVTGLSATLDCDSFDFSAHTITTDRDNTGANAEGYIIRVADGNGANLYNFDASAGVILGTIENIPAGTEAYTSTPNSNPLTVEYISIAGNGLPEQVAFSATGACSLLDAGSAAKSVPTLPLGGLLLTILGLAWLGGRKVLTQRA